MKSILLADADIVFPRETRQTSLLIQDNRIVEISDQLIRADEIVHLNNTKIFPGFIDIHNHGAIGFDVNNSNSADFIEVGKFLAKNGITTWLPTLVPDSDEAYRKTIDAINSVMSTQQELPVAQIAGVHYEGVYANKKMCGALRPQYFKSFSNATGEIPLPMLKAGVHMTTLAPEIENGIDLIKTFLKKNWKVSIGHTSAGVETLGAASTAGANHFTHMFNAMTGIHHRDIGVAGWALADDRSTFDIIADGVHVDPRILKLATDTKTADFVSLISDSIAPTGLGDGDYEVWGENISVIGGKTRNERGTITGSVITMLDAFKMMRSLGFTNSEVSKMASLNPAKLLGIDKEQGSIEVGKLANLLAIDNLGNVKLTMVNGTISN